MFFPLLGESENLSQVASEHGKVFTRLHFEFFTKSENIQKYRYFEILPHKYLVVLKLN